MSRLVAILAILAIVVGACGGTTEEPTPSAGSLGYADATALRAALDADNPDLYASVKLSPNAGEEGVIERTISILPRCYATYEGTAITPSSSLVFGAPIGGQTCEEYPTSAKQPEGSRIVGEKIGAETLWISTETSNVTPVPGENTAAVEFLLPDAVPAESVWTRVVIIEAGGQQSATPADLEQIVAAEEGALAPLEGKVVTIDLSKIKVGSAAIVVVQLVWRTEDGDLRGMVAYPFSYIVTAPVTIN